jgi:PAS domain S-box-containing protein
MNSLKTSTLPDTSMLKSIIVALSTKLDRKEILSSGSEVLLEFFKATRANIWIRDKTGDEFRISQGMLDPLQRLQGLKKPVPQSCLYCLTATDGSLEAEAYPWIPDDDPSSELFPHPNLLADTRMRAYASLFQLRGVAAALIIPILTQSSVIAVIELVFDLAQEFDSQSLVFARSVASAIGSAIETGDHYQSLQNYAEFLDGALAQRTSELKAERDRTQAILEALGEAVVVTDLEWRILYANPAATYLTGYSRDELLGQRLHLWRSQRQTAEFYTQVLSSMNRGSIWKGEVINSRKDGSIYDAALAVAPLPDPNHVDRTVGFVTVQRDISPIKAAENLKDQFISNVSHELRTPVSVITLLTDNLVSLYDRLDDEKRKKLIADIREHSQELNNLIGSVLEISRIDSGQVTREYRRLNVTEVVSEEVKKQRPLSESKGQRLKTIGDEQLMVIGNEGQLRQIFRNLINNAIKYSPESSNIEIECRAIHGTFVTDAGWPGRKDLPTGSWAGFRVSDNGIGIDNDQLSHLFERFYRVEAQGNIPGAGLGLSIAKDLIEIHSGFIGVASIPDQGSTFTVYLPLLPEE